MKSSRILIPLFLVLVYVGLIWLFDLQENNVMHAIVLFTIIMAGNILTGKIKKKGNSKKE